MKSCFPGQQSACLPEPTGVGEIRAERLGFLTAPDMRARI